MYQPTLDVLRARLVVESKRASKEKQARSETLGPDHCPEPDMNTRALVRDLRRENMALEQMVEEKRGGLLVWSVNQS